MKELNREIVLDTETTGLSYVNGDKLIEIGCVEIVDKMFTGNFFHTYLKTDKLIHEDAFRIHGINNAFLQDKPLFQDKIEDFLHFVGGDKIIVHNAPFDIGFINNEISTTKHKKIPNSQVIDTLVLARRLYPGQPVNLNALCKKFSVSLQHRTKHGALVDAKLLAQVYLVMTMPTQASINFDTENRQGDYQKKRLLNRTFTTSEQEKRLQSKLL